LDFRFVFMLADTSSVLVFGLLDLKCLAGLNCSLGLGFAVGARVRAIDLVRKVFAPPLGTDGLAGFGVVRAHGVPALLLDPRRGRLLVVQLLLVQLELDRALTRGRRVVGLPLLESLVGVVELGVELLDALVGVLEERLCLDPVVRIVLANDGVTLALDVTGGDLEGPTTCAEEQDEPHAEPEGPHGVSCPPTGLDVLVEVALGHGTLFSVM